MSRELTREEKRSIRKLVFSLCANFDREYGCLPLDGPCYMLGKCWTGAYCRYFRDAVLPNDLVLEAALTAAELTFDRPEQVYIDGEKMYQTTYNTEVLLTNGE